MSLYTVALLNSRKTSKVKISLQESNLVTMHYWDSEHLIELQKQNLSFFQIKFKKFIKKRNPKWQIMIHTIQEAIKVIIVLWQYEVKSKN